MNIEQQKLQERVLKQQQAAVESTKSSAQLVTVHVKNSNPGMEDISLDVPSHWRFGQLKRILVNYHSQLVAQSCSHTQLQFMIAGKIIDDRNTLSDQLNNGVGMKQSNIQGQNTQQKEHQINIQPQLTIYLLKEQQPSVNAVEIDSQRKLLDQKIVTESIWNQYVERLQQMQGKENKEESQFRQMTLEKGKKEERRQQIDYLQFIPLFDPTIQANLEIKLKQQKEISDKKLADAAAANNGRGDANNNNNNNNNINGNAQNDQLQDQANFSLKMFIKFMFFVGVIIRNFEGVILYVLLGIFTGYMIVKYQEYNHNQQKKREQQNNRNNPNNGNLPQANNNNNNNNNGNQIPPNQANNNNNNGINSNSTGNLEINNVNLSSQSSNNTQADKVISSENGNENEQNDNQEIKLNNQSDPFSQGEQFGNVPLAGASSNDSFPIDARESKEELKKPTSQNITIASQSPNLAGGSQQQQIIPDLTSKKKKRKPTGILLFILRINEFIVCLVMSLFPPWHIEFYNKGNKYEEEEQPIQHPNPQLTDMNNNNNNNLNSSGTAAESETQVLNNIFENSIQRENELGSQEPSQEIQNIVEQEIIEESKQNLNEIYDEIKQAEMSGALDIKYSLGEYSEEMKKNQ